MYRSWATSLTDCGRARHVLLRARGRRQRPSARRTPTTLTRRHVLDTCTAASVLTAAGVAPAPAQTTRLHFLQRSHFIPAADSVFEEQAKEFGKQA